MEGFDIVNLQIISTQPPVLKIPHHLVFSCPLQRQMDQPGLSPPALLLWNHGVRKCNESAQLKQGEHIPNGELWLKKSHPLDKVIKYASVLWKGAMQISDTAAAQSHVLHLKGACFCRRCVSFFSPSVQLLKAGFHEKSHGWWFSVNYKVKAVVSW